MRQQGHCQEGKFESNKCCSHEVLKTLRKNFFIKFFLFLLLMHIYGIQKDGNDNPACETAKETQMYNSLLDSVGEGEGRMTWENGIETCIISHVK